MSSFIVIRSYTTFDNFFCKELLKTSIMDSLNETFLGILTDKPVMITLNALVLILMFMLIVVGYPIIYCIIILLIPSIVLYIFLYAMFWYETRNVENETSTILRTYTSDNSSCFWIVEAYDNYLVDRSQRKSRYIFMTQEQFNRSNHSTSSHTKKSVGIIGFCKSNRIQNSGWIKRLCIHKDYRRIGIGSYLINQVIQFGYEQGYESINVLISQYEIKALILFGNKGFRTQNIHSKPSFKFITFYELKYEMKDYHPRY
ncbi:uncharacterized protein LOC124948540 isoform X3 [Vespa velutina]|uniref:uncharacterized protein LOC124948540 isoform X3 n=1 Tax=Vespa velutina TaxID=202808 RepID=UPI001FB2F6B6|nr:uncharacterized protein LOC124948540 isoform X3 [Vespa velutina]